MKTEKNYKAVDEVLELILKNLSKEIVEMKKVDYFTCGYEYKSPNYGFKKIIQEYDFTSNPLKELILKVNIANLDKAERFMYCIVPNLQVTCPEEISEMYVIFVKKEELEKQLTDFDYANENVYIKSTKIENKNFIHYKVLNFNPSYAEIIPINKMLKDDKHTKVKYTANELSQIEKDMNTFSIHNARVVDFKNISNLKKNKMLILENKKYFAYESNPEKYREALRATGNKTTDNLFFLDYIEE